MREGTRIQDYFIFGGLTISTGQREFLTTLSAGQDEMV
jgi:hypothetical protein